MDHTGYVWTFLDQARDPGQIRPGAIAIAGDEDKGRAEAEGAVVLARAFP